MEYHGSVSGDRQQQEQRIAADGDDHDDTATASTDMRTTEMPTTAAMPVSGLSLSIMAASGGHAGRSASASASASAGASASAIASNDTPMTRYSDISPSVMDSEGHALLPTPSTMNTALVTTGTAASTAASDDEAGMTDVSYTIELKGT